MYIQLINLIIALFTDKPLHDKARFEDLDRDLIELKDERINSILNFEERTLYTRRDGTREMRYRFVIVRVAIVSRLLDTNYYSDSIHPMHISRGKRISNIYYTRPCNEIVVSTQSYER